MASTFIPSPQQQAIFDAVEDPNGGNLIIEAVAGAGKTKTLEEAVKLMTGSIFLGAYNTKMAKELRERVVDYPNARAGTFHSAGMNALRRAITIKGDPDPKKVEKLIEAYIAEKGRRDLEPIVETVASVVSMAKQRGIGCVFSDTDEVWHEMIEHFDLMDDVPEDFEERIDLIVQFSRVMLRRSNAAAKDLGIIDFDDMIYLPLVMGLRMFKNQWVLIDEAQDTNPTRRALAMRMLAPGGRLIAVGDPRQAIYGFSGADNDALAQIARDFGARAMPLTVTYRCPKSVVAVAQEFVSHIEAHETAPEGRVRVIDYKDLYDHVAPGDMILSRYNKYLVGACFKLIRRGVAAKIEGRAIGQGLVAIMRKWKTQNLDLLAERTNRWIVREAGKAEKEGKDTKADAIRDRGETVLVLIDRAREEGIRDVAGLIQLTTSLFDDRVVDAKNMVTLCSIHRSKGLENPRVFILGLHEIMGRECRLPWMTEQEINLQYVAATRAMEELIEVIGIKEEPKQREAA